MKASSNDMDNEPEFDPNEVQIVFSAAEELAGQAQIRHSEAAQYAGFTKQALHDISIIFVALAQLSEDMPEVKPIVASGLEFAKAICEELQASNKQSESIRLGLYRMSTSVLAVSDTAGTAALSFGISMPDQKQFEVYPAFIIDQGDYVNRLRKMDPALADTYQEIGQAYHGTTADPARAAIGLMRQVFDHFFSVLAPDDVVRASPYWKPKNDVKDPNSITRRERITYAAYTHISDQNRAESMIASIDTILETYKILNKLHTRGKISTDVARSALKTMKSFIESWIDAMAV